LPQTQSVDNVEALLPGNIAEDQIAPR